MERVESHLKVGYGINISRKNRSWLRPGQGEQAEVKGKKQRRNLDC